MKANPVSQDATGRYYLIQYLPNPRRREAINIGVVLAYFRSVLSSADTNPANMVGSCVMRLSEDYLDRVTSTFGDLVKPSLIEAQANSFKGGFRNLETLEKLEQFRAYLCNEIRMTPSQEVDILDTPEKELERLLNDLVLCPVSRARESQVLNLATLTEDEAHTRVTQFFSREAKVRDINTKLDDLSVRLQDIRSAIRTHMEDEKKVCLQIGELRAALQHL